MKNGTPADSEPRYRTHTSGAFRQFRDSLGILWTVYDVRPSEIERRFRASAPPNSERRSRRDFRVNLGPDMAGGWLAFMSEAGEARRMAPIPQGWELLSSDEIAALCISAPIVAANAHPIRW